MSQYFHLTLGPVQGFVAQARRTRDFWAGSFLLSWLSGVAMKEVRQQQGELLFPTEDESFLAWISGEPIDDKPPKQGSNPNRFKAEVGKEFSPQQVVEAVDSAWRYLADLVWEKDLEGHAWSTKPRVIWQQQVEGFWEISWALTDKIDDSSVLDRRKNWRSYQMPPQAGVKCMMMDGWQELSGAERPHREGRETLEHFWGTLIGSGRSGIESDLREGEHLCAIGYIKRRFARYFSELDKSMPGGWRLKGWKLPLSIPSVSYMAAAPWLAELIARVSEQGQESLLQEYHDHAKRITNGYEEWDNTVGCVDRALKKTRLVKKWVALDGNVFFDHALDNPRVWSGLPETIQDSLAAMRSLLHRLRTATAVEPVSPFYALLMMDGDSLGQHMSDSNKQEIISQALKRFTDGVEQLVVRHDGFLIYAGGDDVLAVLPLEQALPCATALRKHYLQCFEQTGIGTTLSGAVEYAHVKMPLTRILKDAHALLDDVAKDQTGRDAIAVRVWKPGGMQQQWSMPWDRALEKDRERDRFILQHMADEFRREDERSAFASGFFYRIRERFDLLNPPHGKETAKPLLNFEDACILMAAEYINSGVNQGRKKEDRLETHDAVEIIRPLMEQCRVIVRRQDAEAQTTDFVDQGRLKPDAALLLRFLADKGIER
jgi:CRISPR-associated protein Cmr2